MILIKKKASFRMNRRWAVALLLGAILGFALVTRFMRLGNPATYYFDEVYHAVTAKAYALNDPRGYEWWHEAPEPNTAYEWLHPPIAKLFMAVGWKYLGQTPWAWRVPGALMGVIVVGLTYWVGLVTTRRKRIGLLAAGLVALDGLLLAQSRIGMNDIYLVAFMLLAIGSYVSFRHKEVDFRRLASWWLLASGIFTGLAMSTKWSGVFILLMVATWEIGLWMVVGKVWWKRVPRLFVIFGVIPILVYLVSFGQFWLQGHTLSQFRELHQQIWWYQTHLEATHAYQSKAWEWPLLIRPVWFWVEYKDETIANIYNLAHPLLAWFGLMAIIWSGLSLVGKGKSGKQLGPLAVFLTAYVWAWMPWLFSPRIMFFYHYAPAIPFLALTLAYWLVTIEQSKWYGKVLLWSVVGLMVITFFWLLPMWIGWPLPKDWWPWLFWLPSWK
jgi:dolichyl-phosphate-mannose-protein mannosyltransferase